MWKKTILVIIVLIIVLGAIFGGRYYVVQKKLAAFAARGVAPTAVATAVAHEQPWASQTTAVGTLEAVSGTEITAQIAGNVTQIAFKSGSKVKKGDLLVRLDDSSQLALLHADQAKLKLAKTTLARQKKLYARHVTSQSKLQKAKADKAAAQAAVDGDRAMLKKLHIAAPFDGVVGIREVSLGQYVSPGTPIVNLQSYNPLYLNFSLPQSALADVHMGAKVAFTVSAYPDKTFEAKVTATGSRVNPDTRNLDIQATVDNAKGLLRPGLYGKVLLSIGKPVVGVVVPDTAVTYSTFGDVVYVVKDKSDKGGKGKIAHAQVVQVADQRNGQALITKGLKAGDTVVIAGQVKLRDGVPIVVNNKIKPRSKHKTGG